MISLENKAIERFSKGTLIIGENSCYEAAAPKSTYHSDRAFMGGTRSTGSKICSKFDNSALSTTIGYVEENRPANIGKATRKNTKILYGRNKSEGWTY
ncbi:hypothetical protein Trydic_g686 [Trypoxylus dichotomus]